ncbi:MAG: hypothetical protein ACRDA3_13055 [Peptostreptococcaceae bacterium]
MDYITKFRRKSQSNGKTQKERIINEGRRNFNKHLDTSPSAFNVQVTLPDEPCVTVNTRHVKSLINNITLNDQRNLDEKYIHFPHGTSVKIGCYVKWDNQDWLIVFREHNSLDTHSTYIMRKCSQIFKYKYKNNIYEIPLVVSNLTLYSDGMADTKHTSIPDSKREIKFGINYVTKNVQLDTRFMLTNRTVFRITHLNDFEHNDGETGSQGIATAIGLQTTLVTEDDVINNIAYNPHIVESSNEDHVGVINGAEEIAIGTRNKYSSKRNGYLEWQLDKEYSFVTVKKNDDSSCNVKVVNNARYVGKEFTLELIVEGIKVESKKIKIIGFM